MTLVTSSLEVAMVAGRHDGAFHIGSAGYTQVGTNGNVWNATLLRYARRITTVNTGGYRRLNNQPEPRVLVDPRYGTSPQKLRARDVMCVTHSVIPASGTVFSRCMWGFGGMPNGAAPTTAIFCPFVGFRMQTGTVAVGGVNAASTWTAIVIDDALTVLSSQATGASALTPHELTILLDGTTNTIYWYVDNVQVHSYTPGSNAAPGQQTPYPVVGTAAGSWQLLYESSNTSSVGTLTTLFDFHMGVMTPLITVEHLDATA